MSFTPESAVAVAKADLAARLEIGKEAIFEIRVTEKDFPDMSLGCPVDGEISAQMISSGWLIELEAGGNSYDYRADKYQIRLHNFEGRNYVVQS